MVSFQRNDVDMSSHAINDQDVHTIIGSESKFEGNLSFEGTVRIDGYFKGDVDSGDALIIGPGAKVDAEIHVGSVIVNGEVNGNIYAKNSIEIHAPGKVRGNIQSPSIVIDRGVIFEGSCKMENIDGDVSPAFIAKTQERLLTKGDD